MFCVIKCQNVSSLFNPAIPITTLRQIVTGEMYTVWLRNIRANIKTGFAPVGDQLNGTPAGKSPETGLIVPDFTIFVYGSSCKFLFLISLFLVFFIHWLFPPPLLYRHPFFSLRRRTVLDFLGKIIAKYIFTNRRTREDILQVFFHTINTIIYFQKFNNIVPGLGGSAPRPEV